jgi:hypothetical protein
VNKWHISKEQIEAQNTRVKKTTLRKSAERKETKEEITPTLTVDGRKFHFEFYREVSGEDLVCIINKASKKPLVMIESKRDQWKILTPVDDEIASYEKELGIHAKNLLAMEANKAS